MQCTDVRMSVGGSVFACGQCRACRVSKRRIWKYRLMLEGLQHEHSCFVTLTYGPDFLPLGGSLRPSDLSLFLKRLRSRLKGSPLRFFAVGEYGGRTWRPHFHAVLFGYPSCLRFGYLKGRKRCCAARSCAACSLLREVWGFGHIVNGSFTPRSAGYVGGYIQKKMTQADDRRLRGRLPEFSRMSLKPGIGYWGLADMASELLSQDEVLDVPHCVKRGDVVYPLGKYLRRELRAMIGRSRSAPAGAFFFDAEILELRRSAREDDARPGSRDRVVELLTARARVRPTRGDFRERRSV